MMVAVAHGMVADALVVAGALVAGDALVVVLVSSPPTVAAASDAFLRAAWHYLPRSTHVDSG